MKRRHILKGLSLGASSLWLSPLLGRLVQEAQGAETKRLNFIVLTDGNGWAHQAGFRGKSSRNSPTLDTKVRSETDWDLPEALAAFAPLKDRLSIVRPLSNPHDSSLHGNGWATLSAMGGDGHSPGGVSIDRLVAQQLGQEDPFSSIALGISTRAGQPAVSVSADGRKRPFPAIGSPLKAYQRLFGAGKNAESSLSQERSLLDGMVQDLQTLRPGLASPERSKLEQMMESYREMERQLGGRQALLKDRDLPKSPTDASGLTRATIEGHIDLIAQAFSFGLTRVAHLSILGFDAHNPGWDFLGFGGDAHESLAHLGSGYDKARADQAYQTVIAYKASQIARLYAKLQEVQTSSGTLADDTVFLWVNSGGGKHHDGAGWHAVVTIANKGGSLRGGRYLDMQGKRPIHQAFLAVTQGLGVKLDTFGDPKHGTETLPGLI